MICEMCGNPIASDALECPYCETRQSVKHITESRHTQTRVIDVETGMPAAETAVEKLTSEINAAMIAGTRIVKVIHGYGSTGKGGAIKSAVRRSLLSMLMDGIVTSVISGEEFSKTVPHVKELLQEYPRLRKDVDLNRKNNGITLVIL